MRNMKEILQQAVGARKASRRLSVSPGADRNRALARLAESVLEREQAIRQANDADIARAKQGGRSAAYLDRLALNPERIRRMADALKAVAALPDPLGEVLWETERPNGLQIKKVSCPLGVLAIIYESRPDVTVEASALCLKSGNAVILKGGSDSLETNRYLAGLITEALKESNLPPESVSLVISREHKAVDYLLSLSKYIDLVIPRGGEALIKTVVEKSRIPVIKHYQGVCHTYVDRAADQAMARRVVLNAKTQRPATCNATETLLVHREIAPQFLPEMARLFREKGVEMRGCPETLGIVPEVQPAADRDWGFEFSDLVIAIKVVSSLDAAIDWIHRYGSGHSEAIMTADPEAAGRFLQEVDAAAVYRNASTRFTDGFEFGLGAEIGISTDKIHARGPMGLRELTSYRYLVYGDGQLRG
jgi:glutamate-5-semialdehyde dehydrogenase